MTTSQDTVVQLGFMKHFRSRLEPGQFRAIACGIFEGVIAGFTECLHHDPYYLLSLHVLPSQQPFLQYAAITSVYSTKNFISITCV